MKKNIFRVVAYFMVAMLVMQVLFNGDSKESNAAHSYNGTISYKNGIRVVVEEGTNVISPCYCISRQKGVNSGDNVTSDFQLTSEEALLINTTMLLGFNIKGTDLEQLRSIDTANYNITQKVIWQIIEGDFKLSTFVLNNNNNIGYNTDDNTETGMNGLARTTTTTTINNNQTMTVDQLKEKVYMQVIEPSYVTGTENLMKWNKETKQFELVLTNTNIYNGISANATVKVDETTLPEGVKVEVDGENLKITSSKEYLNTQTIKIYKRPEAKGKVVAWKNGDYKQPQVSLDYDEDPIAKVMELQLKTEEKPVEVTPTVEPTKQPQKQEQKEPVKENENITIKDEVVPEKDETTVSDESPKTGDSTNIALGYQLLIAALFSMVCVVITNVILKKKNRL